MCCIYAGAYRVLIPDLYKGKVGVDAEEASHVRLTEYAWKSLALLLGCGAIS